LKNPNNIIKIGIVGMLEETAVVKETHLKRKNGIFIWKEDGGWGMEDGGEEVAIRNARSHSHTEGFWEHMGSLM
jgi:hypothetical protein